MCNSAHHAYLRTNFGLGRCPGCGVALGRTSAPQSELTYQQVRELETWPVCYADRSDAHYVFGEFDYDYDPRDRVTHAE